MTRSLTYFICSFATVLLSGCKALEPIDQTFFLGKFMDQEPTAPVAQETYPVLIFRTPGYEMWSKRRESGCERNSVFVECRPGRGHRSPGGEHHLKVRPEEGGLDFCDLKLSLNESSEATPAYVEVFERYNPTGQMLSMILAEIEATTRYPLEPGQTCFGRFGLVQGVLPEGTDLEPPLTAQADRLDRSSP